MSENLNRGTRDFSRFDTLSTDELEEILRLDAENPEGQESDTELLLYVMGVLADRKRNSGTEKTAAEAFESFKKNYLPCGGDTEFPAETRSGTKAKPAQWRRNLSAIAAVLAVIICTSITVNALGCDIWGVVAKWAQETFYFDSANRQDVGDPTPDSNVQYTSLQEVLSKHNIETDLVPAWIPDGYELTTIKIDETPIQETYIAYYSNGEKTIKISVRSYVNSEPEQIEQSDNLIEIVEIAGVSYYIFEDNMQFRAAWIIGKYECYISGEVTLEQLKMMIDSI